MVDAPSSLRTLQRRATIASLFLAAHATITCATLLPQFNAFLDSDIENAPMGTALAVLGALGAMLAVIVFTGVVFLMWLHRAAKNLRELEPERQFSASPGWAVGWWFIPFANLVKPAYVVHEVWFWSQPGARDGDLVIGKKLPGLIIGWWAFWLASNFIDRIAQRATHISWEIVAVVSNLAAAALCILVIRHITAAQAARFAAQTDVPTAGRHVPDVGAYGGSSS